MAEAGGFRCLRSQTANGGGSTTLVAAALRTLRHLSLQAIPDTAVSLGAARRLRTIGGLALRDCASLEGAVFPDGVTLGPSAFNRCEALKRIALRNVVMITAGDFFAWSCGALTDVALPAGLRALGNGCFGHCVSLTALDLSATALAVIGDEFLANCTALRTVALPAGVEEIGSAAFRECSALLAIDLSHTLLRRINHMFAFDCASLTRLLLPATVEAIGGGCVNNCERLAHLDLSHTAVQRIGRRFALHRGAMVATVVFPEGFDEDSISMKYRNP